MKTFLAFLKKELLEVVRTGKLIIILAVFVLLSASSPALTWVTPIIMDLAADELAAAGMAGIEIQVDALTSWAMYFENIAMAMIVFAFVFGSSFTKEYSKNTLILVLTKGFERYKIVIAKAVMMLSLWTVSYWIAFAVTYVGNDLLWDNSVAVGLWPAVLGWWVYGLFIVALIVLFSSVMKGYIGVLLGTGGVVFALTIIDIIPKASKFTPMGLLNYGELLVGAKEMSDIIPALIITLVVTVAAIGASIPLMNRREI